MRLVRFTNPQTRLPFYLNPQLILVIAHGTNPLGTHLETSLMGPQGRIAYVVQEGVEECAEIINNGLADRPQPVIMQ